MKRVGFEVIHFAIYFTSATVQEKKLENVYTLNQTGMTC